MPNRWVILLTGIITYIVMVLIIYAMSVVEADAKGKKGFPPIPWQYDYPYRGKITKEELLPQEVHLKCGKAQGDNSPFVTGRPYYAACAFVPASGEWCHLVLPLDIGIYTDEEMLYILRHEIAHCNGWNAKHDN